MPNFQEIKSRVRDYLMDLPTETDALVGEWVNKALRDLQERHNFRAMQAEVQAVTEQGERVLATRPSDWKRVRERPWLLQGDGGSKEIDWAPSRAEMIRAFPEDDPFQEGAPKFILETSETFEIYPVPDNASLWNDGNHRVRLPYWAYKAELAADADTNWFTVNAHWYLIFAAVAEGMIFNRDEERAALYVQRAEGELQRVVSLDKRSVFPRRVTLTPFTGVWGNTTRHRL